MKRLLPALLTLALALVLSACDDVTPSIAGTPTPSASPTPLPAPFTAEITAVPQTTDQLGNVILADDHYFQFLSFGDMRVYEYDDGTFLDGVCVNTFPLTLDGKVEICYYNGEGKLCGKGTIHNAEGGTALRTGTNPIYAEISTDIDVRNMDFILEVDRAFQPVNDAQ